MAEQQVTVITAQGAKSGNMPERDAEIVKALTEITGNIADVKPARK